MVRMLRFCCPPPPVFSSIVVFFFFLFLFLFLLRLLCCCSGQRRSFVTALYIVVLLLPSRLRSMPLPLSWLRFRLRHNNDHIHTYRFLVQNVRTTKKSKKGPSPRGSCDHLICIIEGKNGSFSIFRR